MAFPPLNDNGFCTIRELLDSLPRLGLPHFQRGQVWDDVAVSRLLESLMLDTPCGSVILWVPESHRSGVHALGVGVHEWGTNAAEFLVVDGQQRLTALSKVFASPSTWAINLAAVPEFRPYFDELPSHHLRRRSLFLPWPPAPGEAASESVIGRHKALTRDLVALSEVLEHGEAAWRYKCASPPLWASYVMGIRSFMDRRLQVVVKRRESLEEIVRLYNRINSSGVVVRHEERAFAAMVAFNPDAGDWLRRSFSAVHADAATRNDSLKRQRERQFGFRLFIRTFAQAAAHHMGQDGADLSRFDEWLWDETWMRDEAARKMVFDEAERVLVRSARVLRDTLMCDDFRFVPSADALRPVFALMLKFPQVEDAVIARSIISLQLDPSVTEHREDDGRIQAKVRRANTLAEALLNFPVLDSEGQVLRALKQAKSMQARWVSMLYWLQRSLGARDYGGQLLRLGIEARAHKEHIIPFSLLHPAFDDLDGRGGHARTHEVNSIGNLTFLSEDFNLEHGSEPVDLRSVDTGLLAPHQLADDAVLAAYEATLERLRGLQPNDGVAAYRQFLDLRLGLLAKQMHGWLTSLMATQAETPALRPTPQIIHPSAADKVRDRQWPHDFEASVLRLVRDAGWQGSKWVLFRSGQGSERNRVTNQLRLYMDGTWLVVGQALPFVEQLVDDLDPIIVPREEGGQWWFKLDPFDAAATALLVALEGTQPWSDTRSP